MTKQEHFENWWSLKSRDMFPNSQKELYKIVFYDGWYRCEKHYAMKE